MTMWQSDWGHLNAMVSPDYEHIGVGFAEAGGYSCYVMMVGWVAGNSGSGDAQSQETSEGAVPYSPFILSDPDENGAIYQEVQPGQAAWTIAAYYEVDLADLLALNNLTEDSILQPGDILLVRPPQSPTSAPSSEPTTQTGFETPIAARPFPSMSPTPTNAMLTETSPRSWAVSMSMIMGSGIALLASNTLVRAWIARAQL